MKRSFGIMCFLAVLLGFLFFHLSMASAADKVFSLRFAHFMPPETVQAKIAKAWCEEIEKRTNGRVKITLYAGGVLVPVTQTYDAVTKEMADIGYGICAYTKGRFPLTEVTDLPLGWKNPGAPTKLVNAYYKQFRPKEFDDVKVLYLEAMDIGYVHLKNPIKTLEDLKGLKIKTSGNDQKIVKALGAVPVGMPVTDTYEALSKGIVQGVMVTIGGLQGYSLGPMAPYTVEAPGAAYSSAFFTVMNKDKWNALPADIKAIIDGVNEEFIQKAAAGWVEWHNTGRTGLLKLGHTFIKLPKEEDARWRAQMRPVFDEYVKMTESKGLPGREALKFCQDWVTKNDN
jgi:TRAP-type transport system periplasmic protein